MAVVAADLEAAEATVEAAFHPVEDIVEADTAVVAGDTHLTKLLPIATAKQQMHVLRDWGLSLPFTREDEFD